MFCSCQLVLVTFWANFSVQEKKTSSNLVEHWRRLLLDPLPRLRGLTLDGLPVGRGGLPGLLGVGGQVLNDPLAARLVALVEEVARAEGRLVETHVCEERAGLGL